MATRRYSELQKEIFSESEIEDSRSWARAEAEAIDLQELRRLLGITQGELARRLGKDQPELSRLERRRDLKLSTLFAFISALGGELELLARFGNKSLRLTNAWLDEQVAGRPAAAGTVSAPTLGAASSLKRPLKRKLGRTKRTPSMGMKAGRAA